MQDKRKCPLCDIEPSFIGPDALFANVVEVDCECCGRFKISNQAEDVLTPEYKVGLSAFCRRADKLLPPPMIESDNIQDLLNTLPTYDPLEKLDNLLLLLADRTIELGQNAKFHSSIDYPLLFCPPAEVMFLRDSLKGEQLIGSRDAGVYITMKGWERVKQIRRSGIDSKRAFVAMWFDGSMDEIYDKAIHPATQRAGYVPLRIDKHPHVNRIDDEIIGQVKRCRFMIADFSGQRHSVYFESGMMIGLGRTVIWMCKKESLVDLKFDVRQFSFIDYQDVEEAQKRLYDKIIAIEGEAPGAGR